MGYYKDPTANMAIRRIEKEKQQEELRKARIAQRERERERDEFVSDMFVLPGLKERDRRRDK